MVRCKLPLQLWVFVILLLLILIYLLISYSWIKVNVNSDRDSTNINITINFLLPMRHDDLITKVAVIPELPTAMVSYKTRWVNSTTAVLSLTHTGYPQGQLLKFKIDKVSTTFSIINKSVSGKVRPKVPLRIISETDLNNIPSKGPVLFRFNTFVNPEKLKQFITVPVSGELKPAEICIEDKIYIDYSRWKYYPVTPFRNNSIYKILLNPGLSNTNGSILDKTLEITYTTAALPKVINTSPHKGQKGVKLYRPIEITLDKVIDSASVEVNDLSEKNNVPGKTKINNSSFAAEIRH